MNKKFTYKCPECKKKNQIGILWTMPTSKLERFLRVDRYKCDKCGQLFAEKY